MTNQFINSDLCHEKELEALKPSMAFSDDVDFKVYQSQVREKYLELLGVMPEKVLANVSVEYSKDMGTYQDIRFVFDSEKFAKVPCHLWIPNNGKEKHSVVICLQGHASGMHISMGKPIYEGDEETISGGDRDFARQIIKEGYAALIIEQRAFGERKSGNCEGGTMCHHPAMLALMLGRTLIGERVWDVSRAIDALEAFPQIDTEKIAIMGNSGGGTCAFYAACFDERIKMVMPSCSVCTYKDSIGAMFHCVCNYIPNIVRYFDMGDLSVLIAPRPFIIVAGREDHAFPIDGVNKTFDTVKRIYKKAGFEDNCKLIVGDGGHRFYASPSWDVFRSFNIL